MSTATEFDNWAAQLRVTHPEMFRRETQRRTSRKRWFPLLLRVYGIRPWELGRYTLGEYGQLVDDLEKHGLGGGFG